ncbi:MAG TPA: signal peptidase II [Chryseosolibacter sp.]
MRNILRNTLILILLTANISCDQVSKNIVRERMFPREEINIISDYFKLIMVENTGAFLSVGNNIPEPFKSIILSFVPLLFLFLAAIYVFANQGLSMSRVIAITFVVGGGFGNIYDRIMLGSVTDFLHIDLGIVKTGIFNMADVSIMVGMVMLLIESFMVRNKDVFEPQDSSDL